jgi:hypothetical protein
MASGRESNLRHLVRSHFPFLFIKCPGYNFHPFWHTICYCRAGENGIEGGEPISPSNTITVWKDAVRFWNGMDAFYSQGDANYLFSFSITRFFTVVIAIMLIALLAGGCVAWLVYQCQLYCS